MLAGPASESLRPIAEKLVWWKSPDETLSDAIDFVSRVMTLGTWDDIQMVRKQWGDAPFQEALRQARPGTGT
jgi:hypothetical protein